jgi:hypothetical protein
MLMLRAIFYEARFGAATFEIVCGLLAETFNVEEED